jgi:hypothetical protein
LIGDVWGGTIHLLTGPAPLLVHVRVDTNDGSKRCLGKELPSVRAIFVARFAHTSRSIY